MHSWDIPWLLLVVAFGAFAAYRDIDDFFVKQGIGHEGLRHVPTLIFLAFNGGLAGIFLAWSLSTGADSPINKIIQVDSSLMRALVIGLGTLTSKK